MESPGWLANCVLSKELFMSSTIRGQISFSITLLRFISPLMFLRSSIVFGLGTLGTGVTISDLNNSGHIPCCKQQFIIFVNGLLSFEEKHFMIFAGMSDFLVDFDVSFILLWESRIKLNNHIGHPPLQATARHPI